MKADCASFTDKGDRLCNEDCISSVCSNEKNIYVLADGLGGHGKGEVASRIVAEEICSLFDDKTDKDDLFLNRCMCAAQKKLLGEKNRQASADKMKTTAVVLYINGNSASYAHIGDSRLYRFEKNKIISRTIDHSVTQMLALAGDIKEKDIRHHEDRNKLLRAMGDEWDEENPEYQIDEINAEISTDTSFLLCSDGFWEYITEKKMTKIMKKKLNAELTLNKMLEVVRKNGKGFNMDNYSAVLIRFKEN